MLKVAVASLLLLAACSSSEPSIGETSDLANEQAAVHFRAGSWEPTWTGNVHAGGTLKIDYDFARLPQCRNQSRIDSWVVEASWRFDGGDVHSKALPGSPGAADASDLVEIPAGAHSLELWFENHAVGGYDHCEAWDSQYGANYKRSL